MRILCGNMHLRSVGFRAILALEDYVTTNVIFVSLHAEKLALSQSSSWTLLEQLRPRSEQAWSAYLQPSCSRQGLHWSNGIIPRKNTVLQNLTFLGGNFSEQCRLKRNTGLGKQRAVKQFWKRSLRSNSGFERTLLAASTRG